MNAPCKGCQDRQVGCHSTCEKYLAYQAEREAIREKNRLDHIISTTGIDHRMKIAKHYKKVGSG